MLRNQPGVDFTHYKQTTIQRRILRRMALRSLEDGRRLPAPAPRRSGELQNLYQDFLIRVTQFFRDPEAFEALKEKVFPALVKNRPPEQPIRIWVAGCSTGEEVYSLAIALLEYLEDQPDTPPIKILATDLNEAALEKARAGVYLDNIEIDVSPERLRRFFIRQDGHYQISKAVRELCVFSRHNWSAIRPFPARPGQLPQRADLHGRRPAKARAADPALRAQSRRVSVPGLLGEHRRLHRLFDAVDAKHRIFAKKPARRAAAVGLQRPMSRTEGTSPRRAARKGAVCGAPWTCSARPTASCWPATPRSAWSSTKA